MAIAEKKHIMKLFCIVTLYDENKKAAVLCLK